MVTQAHLTRMQQFGPSDIRHSKVEWLAEWEDLSIFFPTALIDFFNHNDPPSPEQAVDIRQFQSSVFQKYSDTEEKIRLAQAELHRLKIGLEQCKKQSYACNIILSPLRRLPTEIIHQIISHLPLVYPTNSRTELPYHVPTILTQVSKSWRHRALSMTTLWRVMHIDTRVCNIEQRSISSLTNRIEQFSMRSGSRELEVRLDDTVPPLSPSFSSRERLLPLLKWILSTWTDRYRLRKLSLGGERGVKLLLDALTRRGHESSAIQSLVFKRSTAYGCVYRRDDIIPLMKALPQVGQLWLGINIVWLGDLFLSEIGNRFCDVGHQLTALYIEDELTLPHIHNLLRACPNLEAANVGLINARRYVALEITHTHLKALVLRSKHYWDIILRGLDSLRLPLLERIAISYDVADKTCPPVADLNPPIPNNFSERLPSLAHISIGSLRTDKQVLDDVFPLLRSAHSATTLSLDLPRHQLLTALQRLQGKPHSLPNLNTLRLGVVTLPANVPWSRPWSPNLNNQFAISIRNLINSRRVEPPVPVVTGQCTQGLISVQVYSHRFHDGSVKLSDQDTSIYEDDIQVMSSTLQNELEDEVIPELTFALLDPLPVRENIYEAEFNRRYF